MIYIHKRVHDSGKTVWRIIRWHNGKEVHYGTFNTLDDTQFESVNDAINGHQFLDGLKPFAQPIYKSSNGQIDYGVL